MASGYCAALAVLAALLAPRRDRRRARHRPRAARAARLDDRAAAATALRRRADCPMRSATAPPSAAPRRTASIAAATTPAGASAGARSACSATTSGGASPARSVRRRGRAERSFADVAGRPAHADALDALVGAWTCTRSRPRTSMEALQGAGIAAGVVADARDLAADPQLAARGYWVDAARRHATLDGVVPRLSATPGSVTRARPAARRAHRRGLARSAGDGAECARSAARRRRHLLTAPSGRRSNDQSGGDHAA